MYYTTIQCRSHVAHFHCQVNFLSKDLFQVKAASNCLNTFGLLLRATGWSLYSFLLLTHAVCYRNVIQSRCVCVCVYAMNCAAPSATILDLSLFGRDDGTLEPHYTDTDETIILHNFRAEQSTDWYTLWHSSIDEDDDDEDDVVAISLSPRNNTENENSIYSSQNRFKMYFSCWVRRNIIEFFAERFTNGPFVRKLNRAENDAVPPKSVRSIFFVSRLVFRLKSFVGECRMLINDLIRINNKRWTR